MQIVVFAQARHAQIRKKSSTRNRKQLSSRNDNREVRERLKTRALTLWGGSTKKHKNQKNKNVLPFVLANVAGYVALYQGVELSGGAVRFITISCWGIWGLWLLTSNYCKHLVGEVIKHPQETLLTFAATLLNSSVDGIAASDERGDDTFLEKQDIEQRPVEPGKDCLFPKSMLLIECNNALNWEELKGGGDVGHVVKHRNEVVLLDFVDESTYIKRKKKFDARRKGRGAFQNIEAEDGDLESWLFSDEDYHQIAILRGDSFTFPKRMILISCDNGFGDIELRDVRSRGQMRQRSQNVTLRFVEERTFVQKYQEYMDKETAMPQTVEAIFKRATIFLRRNFLVPSSWVELCSRPFALFGSIFSHVEINHILANLGTLHLVREAEEWMGTPMFTHLYLTSALTSKLFCCAWHELTNRGGSSCSVHESLGASGPISGVLVWWCIECHKRRSFPLVLNGRKVHPLWFWMLYVAIDISGLLQLGTIEAILTSIFDEYLGEGSNEESAEQIRKIKKLKGPIGYDAHIGGALAGALWQVAPVLCTTKLTPGFV